MIIRRLARQLCLIATAVGAWAQQPVQVSLTALQVEVARLTPGNPSATMSFKVDTASSLLFQLEGSAQNLQIAINTPSGQAISATNVVALGGEYGEFDDANNQSSLAFPFSGVNSSHYVFQLPSSGSGNYSVTISRPPGTSDDEAIVGELISDSALRAALFTTEATVPANHRVVVTAAIFDGKSPIANAKVDAYVRNSTGESQTMSLVDDGAAPDQVAGDGLYSGVVTETTAGTYSISAEISGVSLAGVSFNRDAATTLTVVPATGTLGGPVLDAPVGQNGASLDGMAISFTANVQESATYNALVRIKTTKGNQLTRSVKKDLTPGQTSLSVTFSATDIQILGEDGPFSIAEIDLYKLDDTTGAQPLAKLIGAGVTQGYFLSQFKPVASLKGDLNNDGKVDCVDLAIIKTAFGKHVGVIGYDGRADVNGDGSIDIRDLATVSRLLPAGSTCQ